MRDQLTSELGGIASTIGSLLGGAVIPLTGAIAALGVELAGAGAAAGAFGAAVYPQIANIKQVSTEQDAYNKAVSEYGANSKQALTAQQKLKSDLSQLTPATRDTANAFINLKSKFQAWSDSLSGTTMPVFTHLLRGLTNIFPLLTPLVKAASAQFLDLSKRFEAFTKTDRFKELVKEFSGFAAGALKNVVSFTERLAKAIAGFVTSAGFKNFLDQGKNALPGIATALKNVAQFMGKFIAAAGPLGGLQLKVFEILADALNQIPMGVLKVLVPALLATAAAVKVMKLAMMGFEFIRGLVLGFQLLAGATLDVDAAMDANPIGAVVLALTALAVGLYEAYKHVGWFHDAVVAVFNWIKDHWKLVLGLLLGPIGLAVDVIIQYWSQIKGAVLDAFNWIKDHWKVILSVITGPIGAATIFIISHWNDIKNGVTAAIDVIISVIKSLISWIGRIVGKTIKLAQTGASTVINAASSIISWVGRIVGKTIKLAENGASAVTGAVGDIISAVGRMAGKTISVAVKGASAAVQAVENLISAVAHLVSKTIKIGVNIVASGASSILKSLGLAHGGAVGHAAEGGGRSSLTMVGEHGPELVSLPSGSRVFSNPDSMRMMSGGGGGGNVFLQFDMAPGAASDFENFMLMLIRNWVRVKGGGNVQRAFGRI